MAHVLVLNRSENEVIDAGNIALILLGVFEMKRPVFVMVDGFGIVQSSLTD